MIDPDLLDRLTEWADLRDGYVATGLMVESPENSYTADIRAAVFTIAAERERMRTLGNSYVEMERRALVAEAENRQLRKRLDDSWYSDIREEIANAVECWERMKGPVGPGFSTQWFMRLDQQMTEWADLSLEPETRNSDTLDVHPDNPMREDRSELASLLADWTPPDEERPTDTWIDPPSVGMSNLSDGDDDETSMSNHVPREGS